MKYRTFFSLVFGLVSIIMVFEQVGLLASPRKTNEQLINLKRVNFSQTVKDSLSKISIKDLNEMRSGKIIKRKEQNGEKLIVLAKGIIVADINFIRKVLLKCEKHNEFIPRFKACYIYYNSNDSIYKKVVLDPPLFKDVEYYLKTNIMFLDSVSIISWKLDTDNKHNSYIRDTYGFWKLTSLDSKIHILTIYMDTDFKFHWSINWILQEVLKSLIKKDLPKMIANVRARVESKENWKIGQKLPDPLIKSTSFNK